MPLMARPPFTAGWLIAIAVRWPPADQPETKSCFGSPPEHRDALRQPAGRGMDLGDDAVEALLRREGVADERDVDAPGERPFGDEGEQLLRAVLPVAAVDEHEHRAVAPRGEVVDAVALVLAVAQVHAFRVLRPQPGAARFPVGDDLRAVLDRGAVVVRGIQRRSVHASVHQTLKEISVSRANRSSGARRRFDRPCSWW